MRDYFKHLLQHLDKLTGLQQYAKLLQTANPKEEIKTLLDILCRVTDYYPFIPDEAKKAIIQEAVISDPEFIGLNAKFISKHLNLKKEFYIKEKDDVVISPDALTGEARDQRIKEFLEAISKAEVNLTDKVDVYKTVREQWRPKDGEEIYKTLDDDLVFKHQRHVEWVKANFDPRTGKPLATWVPEDKWEQGTEEQTTLAKNK